MSSDLRKKKSIWLKRRELKLPFVVSSMFVLPVAAFGIFAYKTLVAMELHFIFLNPEFKNTLPLKGFFTHSNFVKIFFLTLLLSLAIGCLLGYTMHRSQKRR